MLIRNPPHSSFLITTSPNSIFLSFHNLRNNNNNTKITKTPLHKPYKTLTLNPRKKMSSSWPCSKCTFINPSSQNPSSCQICLSPKSPSSSSWSCPACTFLNPYRTPTCEICGTRASASLLSSLELDDDDLDHNSQLGSSIGSVFLPLRKCSSSKGNVGGFGFGDLGVDQKGFKGVDLSVDNSVELSVDNGVGDGGGSDEIVSGGKRSLMSVLRPCSSSGNKRKVRDDDPGGGGNDNVCGFSGFRGVEKAVEVKNSSSLDDTPMCSSESKTWKIMSYNIWFREDLEILNRMRALGNLIELHSPDVICFQEVTPNIYEIFQRSNWWKGYKCSIPNNMGFPGGYFCMQLSKLLVKSYSCRPFHNSIMGRELCIAEVNVAPNTSLVVATSHLESPCPAPPTWDQMFSKQRVEQAKEAVEFLESKQNVIFCGDMNWDDKLDGPFPLSGGWADAWTELRPGEVGYTYDTKSNKMLSGNRALQKRLDRFLCKLKDFKISGIEMIGMDEIPELSYVKEKKVKGQVKELVLPVLPSDHYGLLLTICPGEST